MRLPAPKPRFPFCGSSYPRHPYLLEASFDGPGLMMSWVKKPLLGRESPNVAWHQPGQDIETAGSYGAEGYIYQAMAPPKTFDDQHAVLGRGHWTRRRQRRRRHGHTGIRHAGHRESQSVRAASV